MRTALLTNNECSDHVPKKASAVSLILRKTIEEISLADLRYKNLIQE